MLILASGCSEGSFQTTLDTSFKKIFTPKRTPQQYMLIAVSDADPDMRRTAIAKVADSKKYDEEWAIKGFIAISLLESDPQTRCVAVRGLGRSGDPRAVDTCLKILNHREYPASEVYPPDDLCRWDATEALSNLSAQPLSGEQRPRVIATLLDRLKGDPDRHVRLAAASGLKHYSEPEVVRGLIEGLRDEDFAVAHQCEYSLSWLTGVTHDCNPYLWEQWLKEHQQDMFANGGELPDSRKPPYEGRWSKFKYKTSQTYQWLFPGRKE